MNWAAWASLTFGASTSLPSCRRALMVASDCEVSSTGVGTEFTLPPPTPCVWFRTGCVEALPPEVTALPGSTEYESAILSLLEGCVQQEPVGAVHVWTTAELP